MRVSALDEEGVGIVAFRQQNARAEIPSAEDDGQVAAKLLAAAVVASKVR